MCIRDSDFADWILMKDVDFPSEKPAIKQKSHEVLTLINLDLQRLGKEDSEVIFNDKILAYLEDLRDDEQLKAELKNLVELEKIKTGKTNPTHTISFVPNSLGENKDSKVKIHLGNHILPGTKITREEMGKVTLKQGSLPGEMVDITDGSFPERKLFRTAGSLPGNPI